MARNVRPVAPAGAVLGEGPVWDARERLLRFVDIKGMAVFDADVPGCPVAPIALG